ncbi:MAG: type IV pilin protein [Gammaproteobacteria bacterium]
MIKIHGFTLIEMLIAIAILGIVASLAIPSYSEYVDRANNADAMSDISAMANTIERFYVANNRYPNGLAEIGANNEEDPWEKKYQYTNVTTNPAGARKDLNNIPINSDYDLYSEGKNKRSSTTLNSSRSLDDIVRGRNGRFIGMAKDY